MLHEWTCIRWGERKVHGLLLASLVALAAGCSSTDEPLQVGLDQEALGAARLEANDVSVLFPLPAAPSSLLGLASAGEQGALLPEPLFADLTNHIARATTLKGSRGFFSFDAASYKEWQIVGMRFDPCARLEPTESDATCSLQIRLIAQPIRLTGGVAVPIDGAIHLIFVAGAADRVTIKAIAGELLNLKALSPVKATGLPLRPHPGIVEEQGVGPFTEAVKAFILHPFSLRREDTHLGGHGSRRNRERLPRQDGPVPLGVQHVREGRHRQAGGDAAPLPRQRGCPRPSLRYDVHFVLSYAKLELRPCPDLD